MRDWCAAAKDETRGLHLGGGARHFNSTRIIAHAWLGEGPSPSLSLAQRVWRRRRLSALGWRELLLLLLLLLILVARARLDPCLKARLWPPQGHATRPPHPTPEPHSHSHSVARLTVHIDRCVTQVRTAGACLALALGPSVSLSVTIPAAPRNGALPAEWGTGIAEMKRIVAVDPAQGLSRPFAATAIASVAPFQRTLHGGFDGMLVKGRGE